MKGKLALCTIVVLSALLVVGIALACDDQPQEPTCPAGEITVSPAVWAEEVCACPTVTWTGTHGSWWNRHSHTYAFTYDKANAPHKCHRPTASSLGVPSDLRNEYNHDNPEWLDDSCTPGYWIAPVCRAPIAGCMDPLALNYNAAAEVDDGSCEYYVPPEPIPGCTDPLALNYDQAATVNDGTCQYPPAPIPGCMDSLALNYNVEATVDDGSCEYYIPPQPTPEPPFCGYTVTTWFQCNTGAAIWAQETGITSGEGTNFVGYAPYNRDCGFCDGLTGIYHREWRNTCDGSGWDEGTWNMPEEFHELNGCPLGGRCVQ